MFTLIGRYNFQGLFKVYFFSVHFLKPLKNTGKQKKYFSRVVDLEGTFLIACISQQKKVDKKAEKVFSPLVK